MESKEEWECRATSFRKPLADVSDDKNRHIARYSKRETTQNPIGAKRGGGSGDEDCLLDQLYLVRSNLSSLARQIDELVCSSN